MRKRNWAYSSWRLAKKRCYDTKHEKYYYYGARGVFMCDGWRESFSKFLSDMGECPANKSIDRINTKGSYTCGTCEQCVANSWPMNCKWSTAKEQARNRTSNRILTVHGFTACLSAIAERYGVIAETIAERLRRDWTIEDAVTKPRFGRVG
jgi:hypothetical protein